MFAKLKKLFRSRPKPDLFLPDGWEMTCAQFVAAHALGRSGMETFAASPAQIESALADGLYVRPNTLLVSMQGAFYDPSAVISCRVIEPD